ncbi:MAG: aminotransferase class I/II-fold pyridoxal phosphate-dependent enzyme [Moorea sp. SIO2B7]|nr:aminotransferase class I/II-fold pyridoxal phosphate-dependent enzyme [Moorena sp. SIO2B7]
MSTVFDKKIAQFLQSCQQSSNEAYLAFKALLNELDEPITRVKARQFLGEIKNYYLSLKDKTAIKHIYFNQLPITNSSGDSSHLTLLQFPSTFSPEEWSFTFYEGLERYPNNEFSDRTVAELGCGNGWITLALAQRCLPKTIYGIDINPKAITCSQLNLYLNALDDFGSQIYDSEGLTLLDRVIFAQSDLLSYFRDHNILLDRAVGCIPQVLSPEPEILENLVAESASDEFLYSLSNYCDKQGYVEDQFGLGLIARALEELIERIKPNGKVILNLGGRPGTTVLERLMTRRGFAVKQIWQTKVAQAEDTDIGSLVEIEKSSGHRFEFFLNPHGFEPINATTAFHYANAGNVIYHAVSVYEAYLPYPAWTKQIMQLLARKHYEEAKIVLDLTVNSPEIAEERLSFLAYLTELLEQTKFFPYQAPAGDAKLRLNISQFLQRYYQVNLAIEHIFIVPSRRDLIVNFCQLYQPKLCLIENELHEQLAKIDHNCTEFLQTPKRVELCCQLIEALKPQIVITALADYEAYSVDSFLRLIDYCNRYKVTLLLDLSNLMEFNSKPPANPVLEYLSEHNLPANVLLICDLVKNLVYNDLRLCFAISQNDSLISHLTNAAALTYSRAPILNQYYYSRLINDLIYFQRPKSLLNQENKKIIHVGDEEYIAMQKSCLAAFSHPYITNERLPIDENTVRLDYSENCLNTPDSLKEAVLESFLGQKFSANAFQLEDTLSALLQQRFGLNTEGGTFVYGNGEAPIFAALVQICREQKGTFLFPQGAYGYFVAACHFFDVPVAIIETEEVNQFKLTAKKLKETLTKYERCYLFFNAPVVNPTGAIYQREEIVEIISAIKNYSVTIIFDTIFSGLEFEPNSESLPFKSELSKLSRENPFDYILLGGISKEFAAAGLRFSYAFSSSLVLMEKLRSLMPTKPHRTLSYAVKKVYDKLLAGTELSNDMSRQRLLLSRRANQLSEKLLQCGWTPLKSQGGLFLVASPTEFNGLNFTYDAKGDRRQVQLNSETISEALFYTTGLLINNSVWTGIPNFCRFVLSVTDEEFKEALSKLEQFKQLVFLQGN